MKSTYLDFTKQIDYDKLQKASQSLLDGNLVVFPTDTVYGIGANPFLESSISNLFHAKNRPLNKPVNVLISNYKMLDSLALNISENEYKLMKAFWPGPLTIILNKSNNVSDTLTSGLNTIGVRMPNNKIALNLIETAGIPIATSSANMSSSEASNNISDIFDYFEDTTSFLIDGGKTDIGIASTIVQFENNQINILRHGSISEFDIKKVLERSWFLCLKV